MRDSADIAAFLATRADMMRLLDAVEHLHLPDAWVGAGIVRNAVWDALTGREPKMASDVDVVYLERADACPGRDRAIEIALERSHAGVRWQVKNQARMHGRNGDAPYRDSADAIAHWPETATAVAARLSGGRVELIAPHGVADLVGLIVRPTPAFARKLEIYRARVRAKNWQARWPELTVLGLEQPLSRD